KGEYYNNRGGCYSNLNDFSHALEDFNKAVELMPGNGKAYLNRSIMHFSLGHITPAVNDLEQAYKLKTGDIPKGYYDQLNIAFQNEIISTYTVKIDQNPAEAINYNIRGVAYFNLKNLSKALIDYNKAIELDPKNVEFLYNRFVLYSQVNDRVNAMLDQQQLIKLGFKGKKSN
ncbi:MAG: tetratricopeptide repeat protein, partial [Bacteroidia bacterium]|nr:tetratricopeptide repeat protein [Bacteroidia bacterium]